MSATLDKYDKQILTSLLEDSSISNLHLSKNIGLAASSCLSRVKNLKKQQKRCVNLRKSNTLLIKITHHY